MLKPISSATGPNISGRRPPSTAPAAKPTAGQTPPVTAFLGRDYQSGSLIVYTFSVDPGQPSGFLIDRTVILP